MNFKDIMKKGSLVAALSLSLTAFAAPAAHADTNGKSFTKASKCIKNFKS